jgi:hypothetical protein
MDRLLVVASEKGFGVSRTRRELAWFSDMKDVAECKRFLYTRYLALSTFLALFMVAP